MDLVSEINVYIHTKKKKNHFTFYMYNLCISCIFTRLHIKGTVSTDGVVQGECFVCEMLYC